MEQHRIKLTRQGRHRLSLVCPYDMLDDRKYPDFKTQLTADGLKS
jgi:hypothetical protein